MFGVEPQPKCDHPKEFREQDDNLLICMRCGAKLAVLQ